MRPSDGFARSSKDLLWSGIVTMTPVTAVPGSPDGAESSGLLSKYIRHEVRRICCIYIKCDEVPRDRNNNSCIALQPWAMGRGSADDEKPSRLGLAILVSIRAHGRPTGPVHGSPVRSKCSMSNKLGSRSSLTQGLSETHFAINRTWSSSSLFQKPSPRRSETVSFAAPSIRQSLTFPDHPTVFRVSDPSSVRDPRSMLIQ